MKREYFFGNSKILVYFLSSEEKKENHWINLYEVMNKIGKQLWEEKKPLSDYFYLTTKTKDNKE